MSALCFACRRNDLADTVSFTYGVFAEEVRWQIVRLTLVPAFATASAAPASTRTRTIKARSVISAHRVGGDCYYVLRRRAGFVARAIVAGGSGLTIASC